jgi:hypothetical protein
LVSKKLPLSMAIVSSCCPPLTLTLSLPSVNMMHSDASLSLDKWQCCTHCCHSWICSRHPGPCAHQLCSGIWTKWWMRVGVSLGGRDSD